MELMGYRRADGTVGYRNHTLIVPLTGCLQRIAWRIADEVPGANALIHPHGCDFQGPDAALLATLMRHLCTHPNVGAVLFLSMGCAALNAAHLADVVADSGRMMAEVNLHKCGGTSKTITEGIALATPMAQELARQRREPVPFSSLVLGTKCGASNPDSFTYAHPVLGAACDRLVDAGATVVLSEDCELYAAADALAGRAANPETAQAITAMRDGVKTAWRQRFDLDLADLLGEPDKAYARSLEHAAKAGSRHFERVFDMSERVHGPGLVILNGPNTDLESMTCLAASGCQLIAFTTGAGTVVGSPVAVTVKMTATHATYERMRENIDLDVSGYKSGEWTLNEAADHTLAHLIDAANGTMQQAERLGHGEIAFPLRGVTF